MTNPTPEQMIEWTDWKISASDKEDAGGDYPKFKYIRDLIKSTTAVQPEDVESDVKKVRERLHYWAAQEANDDPIEGLPYQDTLEAQDAFERIAQTAHPIERTQAMPDIDQLLLKERMKINELLHPHNLIIIKYPDGSYAIGSEVPTPPIAAIKGKK